MTVANITADAIKALFPHPTLRATQQLTNDVLLEWFIKTRQNLASIDSMLGGGQHGLLRLAIEPQYYQQRYGTKFIIPDDPGVTQYPQGATSTEIANIDNVVKAIKEDIVINQIVNACPKSYLAGVSIIELFRHLAQYLQITSVDIV